MQFLMNLVGFIGIVFTIVIGVNYCSGSDSSLAVTGTPPVTVIEKNTVDLPEDQESGLEDLISDGDETPAASRYVCYTDVSSKLRALINKIRACDLEDALINHDSSVLSIIPAKGYKNGVADVFKKYRLHVNQNVDVTCQDQAWADTGTPGCKILIYVSRIRASNKYSDLAGWYTVWFRGVDDPAFRPLSQFAEHISNANDSMLRIGGFIDVSDRP